MNILAYDAEKQPRSVLLRCSDGRIADISDWSEAITFLLEPCAFAVCWNIDQFWDALSTIFPKAVVDKVNKEGKAWCANKEKVYYQSGRVWAVTYIRETNVFALHRYSETPVTDVNDLAVLAHKVIDAYRKFGIEPTALYSPVATYANALAQLPFPRACDLPESALPMLNICEPLSKYQEWREVYKLGHWEADNVSDFDVSAAYPSLVAKLPDITHARFFESDTLPDNYSWGVLDGTIHVTKDVSPFYCSDGTLPKGTWPWQITTDQLWLLKRWNAGSFDIKHGWFFQLPQTYSLPFNQTMIDLYSKREHPNPLVGSIAKGISVGIWGRFAQRYDNGKLGADFNSIYALMTLSRCSVKVADFIYRNALDERVISVMVDGTLIEGERLPITTDKRMGEWRLNEPSPFLVLSSLYQWGSTKHPDGRFYQQVVDDMKTNPRKAVYGDVDLHLIERDREFERLPRNGGELLAIKYQSKPYTIG